MSVPRTAVAILGVILALCASGLSIAATTGSAPQAIELHRLDGGSGEVAITFGIPFPPGKLSDADSIRILDERGAEIPAHVEPSLRWHFRDNSIRSVRVQLRTNVGKQARRLSFATDKPRTMSLEGWEYALALSDADHGLRMPRALATLDPRWLTASLMAGPQQPVDSNDAYDRYFETQFAWAKALPVSDSTAWLFDRPSTLFKRYVRSGNIEHLRSAVQSYRFYMAQLQRTGQCPGGWQFGKANACDAKYVYVEPILLALGLTGDDSLHDADLVNAMVTLWDEGGWSGIGGAYLRKDQNFTERHIGLGLLAVVSAYELTGDAAYRERIRQRIGWLFDHQRKNPDGLGDDGSWRHSWQRHEGAEYSALTDVRGASPWMSENIIDGLWHAWLVTADARIPGMIRAFGQYLENFGWIKPTTFIRAGHSWRDDCSGEQGQIAWYWSSSQAPLGDLIRMQDEGGEYSDAHTVELGMVVAAARYFETDALKQKALDSRMDLIAHSYALECARSRSTARRFNWNNRSAGIVPWFKAHFEDKDPPGIPPRPL